MWLEVFLGLFAIRSFTILFKVYIIRNFYSLRGRYELLRIFLIDSIMIAWLVYGNDLYFSKKNDCDKVDGTLFMAEAMGTILFVGYLMMGFYLLLLCTIPCLYWYIRQLQVNLEQ